ncbi:hypothetical protein HPP92_002562 [Vanilla planifolia]|uniref:OPA3-like protein n=1 Tax=Vanilla planifolia TaxID=51239 RepID=A0A835S1F1_VANPL|nr:hypothetical protein HPP92_002562 [Vanilla planifolia]
MILPLAKLGTLALKTFCKPIANRLKKEAGVHPKFRQFIVNIAQVAGVALVFEVQRSARSEARKEEARRQDILAMKQREEEIAKELELLKQRVNEIEHHSRKQGLLGILQFKHENKQADSNPVATS